MGKQDEVLMVLCSVIKLVDNYQCNVNDVHTSHFCMFESFFSPFTLRQKHYVYVYILVDDHIVFSIKQDDYMY